jgi:hypothetical protein
LRSSFAEIQQDIDAFVADYKARAAGPTKWPRLAAFLTEQYKHVTEELLAKEKAAAESRLQEALAEARKWEAVAKAADGKVKKVSLNL